LDDGLILTYQPLVLLFGLCQGYLDEPTAFAFPSQGFLSYGELKIQLLNLILQASFGPDGRSPLAFGGPIGNSSGGVNQIAAGRIHELF
jgi:hypothetical protein